MNRLLQQNCSSNGAQPPVFANELLLHHVVIWLSCFDEILRKYRND